MELGHLYQFLLNNVSAKLPQPVTGICSEKSFIGGKEKVIHDKVSAS